MGDPNQQAYVARLANQLQGPILEVGSKDYGSTENLRPLFASHGEYVGVDMAGGPGVDVVCDLTQDFEVVDAALNGQRFGTIICLSVLEHVDQPFRMAENLSKLLKPGGAVCLSAPFAWKFHGYPSDYWRFTHEGIRKLFSGLEFQEEHCGTTTSQRGSFRPLDTEIGKIALSSQPHRASGHPVRGMIASAMRTLGKVGVMKWLTDYRYVMAPTNLLMLGIKPADSLQKAA